MIQPIVLESTQDHATISRTGICVTLTASMGTGGGMIPMIIDELRECEASSFIQTGFSKWQKCNVSDTLRASGGDNGGVEKL